MPTPRSVAVLSERRQKSFRELVRCVRRACRDLKECADRAERADQEFTKALVNSVSTPPKRVPRKRG